MAQLIRQLDMELFGGCNYKCVMCPQGIEQGREKEFKKSLTWKNFIKIVEDAISHGVEVISLHGGGEPTMHKRFIDSIKYVKSKGVKCTTLSNGYTLDDNLIEQIVESGIDVFKISVIGYDEETYKTSMKKDAFNQVRENVKKLVEATSGTDTRIESQHLILDSDNKEFEVESLITNWVNYTGIDSEIWLMHNWSGVYTGPYERRKEERRGCGRPFKPMLQVRAGGLNKHQGAVVACCMVLGNDKAATLGHLDDQTIEEVLNGEKYQELRSAHKEERFDDIPYCKDCDQLWHVPESLVWTNMQDRQYKQSKWLQDFEIR
jgi:pyruvate-formate lyase-activating enzyme